jgi:hypothetical protein
MSLRLLIALFDAVMIASRDRAGIDLRGNLTVFETHSRVAQRERIHRTR